MTPYKPHKHQQVAAVFLSAHRRCALFMEMGLGKTVATLTDIAATDNGPVLVLAPKRVAQTTWPDEVQKWTHLQGLTVVPVIGTTAQRMKALKTPAHIYTMNYENLPWLVDTFGAKWPFQTVIADESTRLKSFRPRQGGKRAQALAKVAHCKVNRFVLLTGTPSPNGLLDLWGQIWFIDQGERLGTTYQKFLNRWFWPEQVGADPHAIKWHPKDNAAREIQQALSDICLSINAADYLELEKPININVPVDLPAAAATVYEEMERDMFAQLENGEVEAGNAAARTMKCLQIANGAVYREDGTYEVLHDEKLHALASIEAEAAGMPLLVAYHFKSDLTRILKAFPHAKGLLNDPGVVRAFNAGEIPMLLVHPASAGHGLNLQHGTNRLVIFGHWWNLEEYQQVIERIGPARQMQAGYRRPVYIYQIIARDTVDELVIENRTLKASVQDALMKALNRRLACA